MTSRLDLRSRSLYALNGTRLEQRYELGPVLGTGGMGAVFKARHLRLDRPVAIKVLRPLLAEHDEYVERFLREAKAASKIRHRNVVEILDYGEAGGMVYSVMEFLVGKDLQGVLRAQPGQRLPWTTVCALLVQIASGLKAAHGQGVIHRDIKPANCFLTDEDGESVVKLVDFGIAKLEGSGQGHTLTGAAQVLGTPGYIAPELVRNTHPVSPRSDIYSLGVMAYRMLSGRVPFKGDTVFELLRHACFDPVPRLGEQVRDLPGDVEQFVMELLAKEPEQRPPDMLAVRRRLQQLSASEPAVGGRDRLELLPVARTFIDTEDTTVPRERDDREAEREAAAEKLTAVPIEPLVARDSLASGVTIPTLEAERLDGDPAVPRSHGRWSSPPLLGGAILLLVGLGAMPMVIEGRRGGSVIREPPRVVEPLRASAASDGVTARGGGRPARGATPPEVGPSPAPNHDAPPRAHTDPAEPALQPLAEVAPETASETARSPKRASARVARVRRPSRPPSDRSNLNRLERVIASDCLGLTPAKTLTVSFIVASQGELMGLTASPDDAAGRCAAARIRRATFRARRGHTPFKIAVE